MLVLATLLYLLVQLRFAQTSLAINPDELSVPVPPHDLSKAISYATSYIVRNCNSEGKFTYQASITDPEMYRDSSQYNILRHAGTIYALGSSYHRHPDKEVLHAIERGVHFLKRIALGPVPSVNADGTVTGKNHPELLAIWSSIDTDADKQPLKAKLGGAGLALVAFTNLYMISPEMTPVPLEDMQKLANFILFMQNEDGGFVSLYKPTMGGFDRSWVSLYYPGEATLGLISLYEIDGNDRWLSGAAKAIRYLYNLRKDMELSQVQPDHWALIATGKLLPILPPQHPDCSKVEAMNHASKVVNSMLLDTGELMETGGCLVWDNRTCPTATRLEGYAAALTFLPSDTGSQRELRKKVEHNFDAGVQYLLRAQVVEEIREVQGMVGAFPGIYPSEAKKKTKSSEVRIDYVQHSLSALMGYERERFLPCKRGWAKAVAIGNLLLDSTINPFKRIKCPSMLAFLVAAAVVFLSTTKQRKNGMTTKQRKKGLISKKRKKAGGRKVKVN